MYLDGQARRQGWRTTDAAGDTDACPPLLTASCRFSHLFTLLFTRKSECMKIAACPPQAIHPLSACTTRPLPFYSPAFHTYIFHAGYYTLFTYSIARSPLAFPPAPAVLDLTDFIAFWTGADRKPGPLPAVRITGVRMHERGLYDGSCR